MPGRPLPFHLHQGGREFRRFLTCYRFGAMRPRKLCHVSCMPASFDRCTCKFPKNISIPRGGGGSHQSLRRRNKCCLEYESKRGSRTFAVTTPRQGFGGRRVLSPILFQTVEMRTSAPATPHLELTMLNDGQVALRQLNLRLS